jgi:hypothetical protein
MLKEIRRTNRGEGEPFRRWFADTTFDLIVWFSADAEPTGFQLCYSDGARRKALTWRRASGFAHQNIDTGEDVPGRHKMTPILTPDGPFNRDHIASRFTEHAADLDPEIMSFVRERLMDFPPPDPPPAPCDFAHGTVGGRLNARWESPYNSTLFVLRGVITRLSSVTEVADFVCVHHSTLTAEETEALGMLACLAALNEARGMKKGEALGAVDRLLGLAEPVLPPQTQDAFTHGLTAIRSTLEAHSEFSGQTIFVEARRTIHDMLNTKLRNE